VLVDSVVKHELASSAYNKRRQSCETAVAAIQKHHPHVEFLRDANMDMLKEVTHDISEEDADCMIRTIGKFYEIMSERREHYEK
jgi:galactokinase